MFLTTFKISKEVKADRQISIQFSNADGPFHEDKIPIT